MVCAECHGEKGQGMGSYPAQAGKSEADLVKALQDYKSGKPQPPTPGLPGPEDIGPTIRPPEW